jgi:hypothetical protein
MWWLIVQGYFAAWDAPRHFGFGAAAPTPRTAVRELPLVWYR